MNTVLTVFFVTMWVVVCGLIWYDALPVRPYGDDVRVFIQAGYVYPRWPLGMLALITAFTIAPTLSVPFLAATAMLVSTLLLLQRWPRQWAIVCPLMTPIWLLFSSGYIEYYPFIAGAWVATLAWLFERPIRERSGRELGMLAGLMSALYIGFAVLSAILASVKPRRAIGWAAVSFAILITISHPAGLPSFMRQLTSEMNVGEEHVGYEPYRGHSAGAHSIMFEPAFALSTVHLKDLAYDYWWGGGVGFLGLLGWAGWRARRRLTWRDPRVPIALLLLGWQTYYFVFMIPRMGPTRDVDLFFTTYLTVAFFAGRLVDAVPPRRVRALVALCAVNLGIAVPLVLGRI